MQKEKAWVIVVPKVQTKSKRRSKTKERENSTGVIYIVVISIYQENRQTRLQLSFGPDPLSDKNKPRVLKNQNKSINNENIFYSSPKTVSVNF